MAVTTTFYNSFPFFLGDGGGFDWYNDNIKVALLDSYVFDANHVYFGDVNGSELSSGGYFVGGVSLIGPTVSQSIVGADFVTFFENTSAQWTAVSLAATHAVVYVDDGSSPATSHLIACIDFGQTRTSTAGLFTINWASGVVFTIATPS